MDKKPKNKGGRPKEDVADKVDFEQVERLGGLGMTDVEIGYILGYHEDTINRYKKDKRFLQALKDGKAKANSMVVAALYKRAIGYTYEEVTYEAIKYGNGMPSENVKVKTVIKHVEPHPTALVFFLKNRMPDRYRDVKEDAPGDKPSPDQSAKVDRLIADAESRVEKAGATCH